MKLLKRGVNAYERVGSHFFEENSLHPCTTNNPPICPPFFHCSADHSYCPCPPAYAIC